MSAMGVRSADSHLKLEYPASVRSCRPKGKRERQFRVGNSRLAMANIIKD